MSVNRKDPAIVIIGAGMTGILLVIKLREAGFRNIILLEKCASMGGTWRENTYPGIACDVPSHAYTYSFEPNPGWSNLFPRGDEIYSYFEKVFHKYQVDQHTRFNEAVNSCVYQDGQWVVETSQGNRLVADLLFSATGILHQPVIPDIPGLETFAGPCFHTARWDHSVDMKHKRVGVIGNGSSATQVIGEIVKEEGLQLTVFQRTAQWVVALKDKTFSEKEKQRFASQPFRMKLLKGFYNYYFKKGTAALTRDGWSEKLMYRMMSWFALRNLNNSVADPVLREKLTPDYQFGCKRVVINATFYDALQQPNAELETAGIEKVIAEGIVTKDGKLHPLDILVLGTGFDPAAYMRPMEFRGRDGLSIEDAWKKKIQAYRSICLPDFPNFFLMLGPNSPIGNFSVIAMSELQTDYILQLIKSWQTGELDEIEATVEAMQDWNAMLKGNMGRTAWTSGCQSWYLDADGDPLAWPDSWDNWVVAMDKPDLSHFVTA